MLHRRSVYRLLVGISLLCLLSLNGCNGALDFLADIFRFGSDADAQINFDRAVQTVSIRAGSFAIETDGGTAIELSTNVIVTGEVTTYVQITGSAFFTLANENNTRTIELDTTSIIIERPANNLLTLINIRQ
jgi:hypothetical protein